jgi:Ca2+-binding RTX toxin-like protein
MGANSRWRGGRRRAAFFERLEDRLCLSTIPTPTGFTATAISSTAIRLTWTDASFSETGFVISRIEVQGAGFPPKDPQQIAIVPANSTSFTDTNLLPFVAGDLSNPTQGLYQYTIVARSPVEDSNPATVSKATLAASLDTPAQFNPIVPDTFPAKVIVKGTGGDDVISLAASGGSVHVTINGNTQDFTQANISTITIYGYAGNDRILIGKHMPGVYILGGDGSDTITGGPGNDRIDGGAGDDHISGGDGDDIITGGTGKDEIYGGNGNDVIDGGDGNDKLVGGAGNDLILGGAGNDILIGGSGIDTLLGGTGNNQIIE